MENKILHYYYDEQNKEINAPLFQNIIKTIISVENINLSNEKIITIEDENGNIIDNENDYNKIIQNQNKIVVRIESKMLNSIKKIIDNHFNPIINLITKDKEEIKQQLNEIYVKLNNMESNFNLSIDKIEQAYQKKIKEKENDELVNNQNIQLKNENMIKNIKNTLNNNIDKLNDINFSDFYQNLENKLDTDSNKIIYSFQNLLSLFKTFNNSINNYNYIVNNNNKGINNEKNQFPTEKNKLSTLNAIIIVSKNNIKISKDKIKNGKFSIIVEIINNGNKDLSTECVIEGKSKNLYCKEIHLPENIKQGETKEIKLNIISSNFNTINNFENFIITLYDQQNKEINSCNVNIEISLKEDKNYKNIIPNIEKINQENRDYEKKLINKKPSSQLYGIEENLMIEEKFTLLKEKTYEMGMNFDAKIIREYLIKANLDINKAMDDLIYNFNN